MKSDLHASSERLKQATLTTRIIQGSMLPVCSKPRICWHRMASSRKGSLMACCSCLYTCQVRLQLQPKHSKHSRWCILMGGEFALQIAEHAGLSLALTGGSGVPLDSSLEGHSLWDLPESRLAQPGVVCFILFYFKRWDISHACKSC